MDNIEDKSTFRKIPYKRSDERAYKRSRDFYFGIGRELVGNVKHHPCDEVRYKSIEVYDTCNTTLIKINLYLR